MSCVECVSVSCCSPQLRLPMDNAFHIIFKRLNRLPSVRFHMTYKIARAQGVEERPGKKGHGQPRSERTRLKGAFSCVRREGRETGYWNLRGGGGGRPCSNGQISRNAYVAPSCAYPWKTEYQGTHEPLAASVTPPLVAADASPSRAYPKKTEYQGTCEPSMWWFQTCHCRFAPKEEVHIRTVAVAEDTSLCQKVKIVC